MILFDNKVKIKWEWNNLIKWKKKLLVNQTLKDKLKKINFEKKTKKPDLSQHDKFTARSWDRDNSV
jgi:hypothetical protein